MDAKVDEQTQIRLTKLNRLREAGIDPYPARFERTLNSEQAKTAFQAWEEANSRR